MRRSPGRTPSVTSRAALPAITAAGADAGAPATGRRLPDTVTAPPCKVPRSRFIGGVPMKPATATVCGVEKISRGVPTWTMRPSMKTAMRSARVIASSWSCVT